MQAIEHAAVEDNEEDPTTEGSRDASLPESTEKAPQTSAPRLSAEQREWLNTVFIPNFRTELMRTLKPEDLIPSGGKRNSRRDKGKARRGAGTAGKDSPTPSAQSAGATAEDAAESAAPENADAAEQTAQRVSELEGENKRLRAVLAETRVDRELVWAAAAQHAINPAQVAHLLKDRVQLDRDLDPIVVNANGDRAYDRYGRPITVGDAVRTFLEENPHLVRPSIEFAGGGSGGTDATARTRRVAAVTGGDLIEEALREGE